FDLQAFDQYMQSSLRSVVLSLHLFADALTDQDPLPGDGLERRQQSGTVTTILSLAGQLSNPGMFTSSVAQSAILGAVRAGAVEVAAQGVRVNAITAIRPREEATENWLKQRTPLKRAALADEIAEAAAYLASPRSAIVTGETLTLDGGRRQLGGVLET
ncbi:MAG: SDR family oxidoreductase, partial [Pseudomonadota bacterium]